MYARVSRKKILNETNFSFSFNINVVLPIQSWKIYYWA